MERRRGKIKSLEEDQEFPGYPKYAPDEDIMKKAKRIEGNLDDDSLAQVKSNLSHIPPSIEKIDMPEEIEDKLMPKDEEDITSDDLDKKGSKSSIH